MPAYSFQRRFAEPILAGTKGGTIRAPRRPSNRGIHTRARQAETGGHARPGEELALYTGMRTKQCRLIAHKKCVAVERVILGLARAAFDFPEREAFFDQPEHVDAFAQFDGFFDWDDLCAFWEQTRGKLADFEGWHIRWLPLPGDFGTDFRDV